MTFDSGKKLQYGTKLALWDAKNVLLRPITNPRRNTFDFRPKIFQSPFWLFAGALKLLIDMQSSAMNMHEGAPVIARQRGGTANLALGILQSARYSLTPQPFHPRALQSANHPRRHATSQKGNKKSFNYQPTTLNTIFTPLYALNAC